MSDLTRATSGTWLVRITVIGTGEAREKTDNSIHESASLQNYKLFLSNNCHSEFSFIDMRRPL